MKRISFNPRFVNEAGNGLIPGKIHTIRQNYDCWKRFEGKEVALFMWEGKPYRSKQKVFCVKRLVSVQEIILHFRYECGKLLWFTAGKAKLLIEELIKNDGFQNDVDLFRWFENYKPGKMAILHFTDFRY
jgi:hypothetical protein